MAISWIINAWFISRIFKTNIRKLSSYGLLANVLKFFNWLTLYVDQHWKKRERKGRLYLGITWCTADSGALPVQTILTWGKHRASALHTTVSSLRCLFTPTQRNRTAKSNISLMTRGNRVKRGHTTGSDLNSWAFTASKARNSKLWVY